MGSSEGPVPGSVVDGVDGASVKQVPSVPNQSPWKYDHGRLEEKGGALHCSATVNVVSSVAVVL